MKRPLLALLLTISTAISFYACGGDDSLVQQASDAGADGSSSNDGGFSSDTSTTSDSGSDAGLGSTSAQIQAVKNAAPALDGGSDPDAGLPVNLPIDHALVTYVRPAVLPDPAGFFLQSEQTGPAIFVAIDPSTLSTPPAPGDDVSMTVTAVTNVVSLHEILAVSGFKVNSHGNAISGLLRHVSSSADLVTNLDAYESEYIELDGFVSGAFAGSGGSVSAEIITAAFSSPTAALKLRLPPTVQSSLDVESTCQFSLTGIMWRFGKDAEPSGWANADLTALTCAAPQVVSAIAPSPTSVNVVFDRNLSASSLVLSGSQFTITDSADAGAGPTISAAVLQSDLRTVTLTTSTQTAGEPLQVTVPGTTLEDVLSKPVDPAHDSADFIGYVTPATLQFNEMSPNISGSHDLVELTVLTSGNLVGTTLVENFVTTPKLLATLPNLQVAAGDIVVVHLNADLADGGVSLVTNETTTKTDCTLPSCYANAWDVSDVAHGQNGLTYSDRVIAIKLPNGQIEDGMSWYNGNALAATFNQETNVLIDAGVWTSCGGTYCNDADAAAAISFYMQGVGSTVLGKDVQRITETNTHTAADWELNDAGSSFGAANTP